MPASARLLADDGKVKVRLYCQGVGDAFLLAFPTADPAEPAYLLIDCGIAKGTPDREARSRRIVENIAAATGGRLDILVITHQHFDHISSFQDSWREWLEIQVENLYLPWTEATAEKGEVKGKTTFEEVLNRAAEAALGQASPQALRSQPRLGAQADFLGFTPGEAPRNMDDAMDFARSLCRGKIRYFYPGDVFKVPGTQSFGYVLGPPRLDQKNPAGKPYIELLEDRDAMYSYRDFGLEPDRGRIGGPNSFALSDDRALPALASGLLAADALDRNFDEDFSPFSHEQRLDWDFAMAAPFFEKHYGSSPRGEGGAWRRIDEDWLGGMADLALRAGDFTNNISLVLAFDLPGSEKMMLFPGDAQVGNWLSWHQIDKWSYVDDAIPARAPESSATQTLMENLLGRVAFYKVGHHGSHNATVKKQGLELMSDDLVAFIPVSVPVAQDLMGYCPMPFYPVLRAIQQKTRGRVFLPNGQALEPLASGSHEELRAAAGMRISAEKLPAKLGKGAQGKKGEQLEDEGPLYLEWTQPAE